MDLAKERQLIPLEKITVFISPLRGGEYDVDIQPCTEALGEELMQMGHCRNWFAVIKLLEDLGIVPRVAIHRENPEERVTIHNED